ncbi:M20/M25/M40 family metallo-hydrolase [Komagataeibacter rhaeticus]|nr:M20/M25/M40 family metallo-hydrolase [Komagataeibacter rhaeticus]
MEGGLFRPYLGPSYRATCERLAQWMEQAGMATRMDAAGNLVGRYEGLVPDAPAVLLGSHIDSVRDGGFYDGMLGVILGIETVAHFAHAGKRFPFALEVIGFGDEEGSRFPTGMLTSHAVAGVPQDPDPAMADWAGRRRWPARWRNPALMPGRCTVPHAGGTAFWPMWKPISNRGPRWRRRIARWAWSAPLPPSSATASPCAAWRAMRVPWPWRCGAMRWRGLPTSSWRPSGSGARARTGWWPRLARWTWCRGRQRGTGEVVLSLDVRAGSNAGRDQAVADILQAARHTCALRGLEMDITLQQDLDATPCDGRLTELMEQAVGSVTGAPAPVLVSGRGMMR